MKGQIIINAVALIWMTVALGALTGKETQMSISHENIRIEIARQSELVDEEIHLRILHLTPSKTYTVRAETFDDMRRKWISRAEFVADSGGVIDTSSQEPVAGSYSGLDPAGLFWSMQLEKPAKSPYDIFAKMSTRSQDVRIIVSDGEEVVVSEEFRMKYISDEVSLEEVRQDFAGKYFVDRNKSSLPAVMVTGGSGGGFLWSEQVAAVLASRGYAALAVAYFDYRGSFGLPKGLAEIPLEYFATAIRWLKDQKEIDPQRVSFIGISKGGELAMLLGATFPRSLRSVVGFAPSPYVLEGIQVGSEEKVSSWSREGNPLPFLSYPPEYEATWDFDKSKLRELHEGAVENASAEELERARIKVENIDCPVLLISGSLDELGPTSEWSAMIVDRIRKERPSLEVLHLNYEKSGHVFFLPNLPPTKLIPAIQIRDVALAERDAWNKLLDFLAARTGEK